MANKRGRLSGHGGGRNRQGGYDRHGHSHVYTQIPQQQLQQQPRATGNDDGISAKGGGAKGGGGSHKWRPPTIALYTYGSPRIGNAIFAAFVNRKVPSTYRVEVDTDIVTMIPKLLGQYRHAGIPVVVDSEEAGSIIVKPTIVEAQLWRASSGSVASHLLSKYRACLEACFEDHELQEYVSKEHAYMTESMSMLLERDGHQGYGYGYTSGSSSGNDTDYGYGGSGYGYGCGGYGAREGSQGDPLGVPGGYTQYSAPGGAWGYSGFNGLSRYTLPGDPPVLVAYNIYPLLL